MNGLNFKYIDKDTDLSIAQPMGWDVVVQGREMQVYRIPEHFHTFGGRWGNNCFWACPRNEQPSYENLFKFEGHIISWGIVVEESNYYGNSSAKAGCVCYITRNGKKFYPVEGGTIDLCLARARQLIIEMESCPFDVNSYRYIHDIVGRKVFFYDQPAVITRYNEESGTVIVQSETGEAFKSPNYLPNLFEDDESTSCVELFSKSLYWFRD